MKSNKVLKYLVLLFSCARHFSRIAEKLAQGRPPSRLFEGARCPDPRQVKRLKIFFVNKNLFAFELIRTLRAVVHAQQRNDLVQARVFAARPSQLPRLGRNSSALRLAAVAEHVPQPFRAARPPVTTRDALVAGSAFVRLPSTCVYPLSANETSGHKSGVSRRWFRCRLPPVWPKPEVVRRSSRVWRPGGDTPNAVQRQPGCHRTKRTNVSAPRQRV